MNLPKAFNLLTKRECASCWTIVVPHHYGSGPTLRSAAEALPTDLTDQVEAMVYGWIGKPASSEGPQWPWVDQVGLAVYAPEGLDLAFCYRLTRRERGARWVARVEEVIS